MMNGRCGEERSMSSTSVMKRSAVGEAPVCAGGVMGRPWNAASEAVTEDVGMQVMVLGRVPCVSWEPSCSMSVVTTGPVPRPRTVVGELVMNFWMIKFAIDRQFFILYASLYDALGVMTRCCAFREYCW